ncbi:MAG: bifunctional oligoribonuclease/PAP phosphatase NrnA [Acidimicrobiia bacterium]|nr:bifunctional oligoribonuclease/PAP phosphatase NrnA [Acidimicrobiia bacterium]NND12927.1 bifunctional oligoribonuclease/PAP phosphatase NrnA [Acidimicrobiia bacterium]
MTDLEAAAALIEHADDIAISCHQGPDGDALGSALGFGLAAKAAGKTVTVSFSEPFVVPDNLRFLPLDLLVEPDEFPEEPGLMVVFDTGDRARLGSLVSNSKAAKHLVVIDHHVTNEGFGDVNVIDGDAGASALLTHRLLELLGWPLTREIATCLHVGLVTDTGRFQYSNTTPELLESAAAMIEAGAEPAVVGQEIYESVPFGYLSVVAAVTGRAVLEPEHDFVWSLLISDDLEKAGIEPSAVPGMIDYIRIAREAETACLVKDLGGPVEVSLRSRNHVDVGAIASSAGGGGHARAAGFTYPGSAEAAVALVRDALADG